jgi:hypothetical protein
MFKVILFLVVVFMSVVAFADEKQCVEQLQMNPLSINIDSSKALHKMSHGSPCRALNFSKVLDEKGEYIWWYSLTESDLQMKKDLAPVKVKVYWILFQRRE